jgi:hypothetical protein
MDLIENLISGKTTTVVRDYVNSRMAGSKRKWLTHFQKDHQIFQLRIEVTTQGLR